MAEIPAKGVHKTEYLDICTSCQFLWFDYKEFEALPLKQQKTNTKEELPIEAREVIAKYKLEQIKEQYNGSEWSKDEPDEWWQWIGAVLGMPVEHGVDQPTKKPVFTWSLALLIVVVSVLAFFKLNTVVSDLGLIPAEFGRYGG